MTRRMHAAAYLSVVGLGEPLLRAIGEGWRCFLLVTVVLLFVQFLVLLRRLS